MSVLHFVLADHSLSNIYQFSIEVCTHRLHPYQETAYVHQHFLEPQNSYKTMQLLHMILLFSVPSFSLAATHCCILTAPKDYLRGPERFSHRAHDFCVGHLKGHDFTRYKGRSTSYTALCGETATNLRARGTAYDGYLTYNCFPEYHPASDGVAPSCT